MAGFKQLNCSLIILALILFAFTGCAGRDTAASDRGSGKDYGTISLGYSGDITEVPLFAAYERGFFKEEGLDAELVKVDFNDIGKDFASGRISGITADYRYLRAMEDGLDVKLVSGLQSGCTQILTTPDSDIDKIRKLKGKTIGVEALGNGPMVVAAKLLRNNGIDPDKDVSWKEFKGAEMYRAIITYEVDAVSIWEAADTFKACSVLFSTSSGTEGSGILGTSGSDGSGIGGSDSSGISNGTGKLEKSGSSSGSHTHSGYQHFYSSFIALDANLVKDQQDKASAVSRAWMRGVKWVSENSEEAARLAAENKYANMKEDSARKVIDDFMWTPGVRYAQMHLKDYIKEQKAQGILEADTNENRFLKEIFRQIVPDFTGR